MGQFSHSILMVTMWSSMRAIMPFVLTPLLTSLAGAQALYRDEGPSPKFDPWATSVPGGVRGAVIGDVDGDGDVDMLAGSFVRNYQSDAFLVLNDGAGNFVPALQRTIPAQMCMGQMSSQSADLDGDGDLDLVAACQPAPPPYCPTSEQTRGIQVWENDGTGRFSVSSKFTVPPVEACSAFGLADLDGDGDIDIVACRVDVTLPKVILLNDGQGRFTLSKALYYGVVYGSAGQVAIGDLNRDGRPDIAIAHGNAPSVLWLTNQNGGYVEHVMQPTLSVRVPDLDGDGYPELVVTDNALPGSIVYTCSPSGKLTQVFSTRLGVWGVGDVDSDGRVDLLCTHVVLANRGNFQFVDATAQLIEFQGQYLPEWPLVFDVDNDGDVDIVGGTFAKSPVSNFLYWSPLIFRNRTRHLTGPEEVKIGNTLTLTTYAGHLRFVTLALSLGEASIPFGSAGTLRLDPTRLWMVTELSMYGKPRQWNLPVPNDPRLNGLMLRFQALDRPVTPDGSDRFGRLLRVQVVQ